MFIWAPCHVMYTQLYSLAETLQPPRPHDTINRLKWIRNRTRMVFRIRKINADLTGTGSANADYLVGYPIPYLGGQDGGGPAAPGGVD
jgi:hypothetical protein